MAAKKASTRKASPATQTKKAATEAQFAEADAKGAPTQDEIDAVVARQGVTGL